MEREGEEGSSVKGWSCETNWTVAKGSSSLDASISFDTSDEDAPDLTSDGTLLLRPSASSDPPPCEVTVFFKGKYEIHRVYARTSARIFEIYYTKDADRNSTKEYLCTVKCGPASSDENLHGSSQSSSVHSSEEESWVDVKTPQMHYEATAEISDAEPCSSLTLRFLSLHTKSSVHVEEIYIYSDPIDESSTSTTQDSSTSTTGNNNASSLFAMLVPNLLQMSKSGLSSRINERYFSPDRLQNTDDVRDQNAKLDTSITQEPSRAAVEKDPVATDTTLPSLVQSQNNTSPYQNHAGNSSKADIRQVNQEAAVNTVPVKVGPASNESTNRIEKILEQLVSKVEKIETYFTKFEEKMVGPIICIESRLERLENQFDLLTKDLQSMRVPPTEEIEKSQDPVSPDDDSTADDVAGCQVETKTCTGTTFKAPDCISEDESDDDVHDGNDDVRHDEMEVDTRVPSKRKPISIDGALASALAAFATEASPNISTVTSDKMNDPDLAKGVPLVSIDEVDSDLLSSFEAVTHTDQNYNAKDTTCAVGPTEDSREDSDIHSQTKPGLFSASVIGEVSDEEEMEAGYAPDLLSSFKAGTHTDQNYNAKDITCAVGPTEDSREDSDIHSQTKPGLFTRSGIGEVSDEEEGEVGYAPDPLSSFKAVTVTNLDDENYQPVDIRDINCEVGPTEENSEVGPSLFSKSIIGEVSDEEEEVETGYAPGSPRFTCNSPLSSSDFEPSLPNYGEILNGWGNDSSSSTDSSFDESFLKTKINTDFDTFNEAKMQDPMEVLWGEMSGLKEEESNTSGGANVDPFIDFENFTNPSEVGPTDSNMPQFESLI
ncbi:40S ribosomal protein S27 isoform X2 [Carex rostrata]